VKQISEMAIERHNISVAQNISCTEKTAVTTSLFDIPIYISNHL
jgi:hypothetical protein